VVTTAYFNRPQATELAKMRDPATGTIWHRMGDVGYLDSLGRLWFCGRKSQRIVTKRGTLFTIPCEGVFSTCGARRALVGVPVDGDLRPVICIEFEHRPFSRGDADVTAFWEEYCAMIRTIALEHPHTRSISVFLRHRSFPVDVRHNAKIFREKLAVWAAKKLKWHRWPKIAEPILPPPTFDSLMQSTGGERT
jgi:acyl-CoA synthetase (AMP-forming)/AMP-acid ligase II